MKCLIAVITAQHESRKPFQQAAQKSWMRKCPLHCVFVHADGNYDSYARMALKDKAVFRYAVREGYDFVFRCCDDTFVFPERLLAAGLEKYDYAGAVLGGRFDEFMGGTWGAGYMHGGAGVWLSRKAFSRLAEAPWYRHIGHGTVTDPVHRVEASVEVDGYIDDVWIGDVLQGEMSWQDERRWNGVGGYAEQGIVMHNDRRFVHAEHATIPDAVAVHAHTLDRVQQLSKQ